MFQRLLLIINISSFATCTSFSQSTASKRYRDPALWHSLKADYFLKNGSLIYFESNYRSSVNPIFNNLGDRFPANNFFRIHNLLGFEYKASPHWYPGISGKFVNLSNEYIFYTKPYLYHKGFFKGIEFIKEGAFELLSFQKSNDLARFSAMVILAKEIKLNNNDTLKNSHNLKFLFSYQIFQIFVINDRGNVPYDRRRFDKTRLRFDIEYILNDKFSIDVFAMRETDYFYSDASGSFPEGNLNFVTPTFGLELKYTFKRK
ncbi:MAG: hypothetical protein FVQ77_09665 [Cytophagales bacterium]|nr:hypothetical protein [Cytophagales bacterium]